MDKTLTIHEIVLIVQKLQRYHNGSFFLDIGSSRLTGAALGGIVSGISITIILMLLWRFRNKLKGILYFDFKSPFAFAFCSYKCHTF